MGRDWEKNKVRSREWEVRGEKMKSWERIFVVKLTRNGKQERKTREVP